MKTIYLKDATVDEIYRFYVKSIVNILKYNGSNNPINHISKTDIMYNEILDFKLDNNSIKYYRNSLFKLQNTIDVDEDIFEFLTGLMLIINGELYHVACNRNITTLSRLTDARSQYIDFYMLKQILNENKDSYINIKLLQIISQTFPEFGY